MIAQILIADDTPEIRDMLTDYLTTAHNHRVIVVSDGVALAQKALEHRPHLIISDIQMPGSYGSTSYKVLQNNPETAKIPVIFISSHPYEKIKGILPNTPNTRFIQKPVPFDVLDQCIKELLPLGGYVP